MKDEKFQPLADFLKNSQKTELTLTIQEIQDILGTPLDLSAFQYREYWANCTASTKAFSWMDAGYEITQVNLKDAVITFKMKDWI